MKESGLVVSLVVVLGASGATAAGPITLDPTNRGWVRNDAGYTTNGSAANNNYYVGKAFGVELRNWFVFDLSGVTTPVTVAKLCFQAEDIFSDDFSEFYTVTSTSTSAATLIAGGGGAGVFTALGTGTFFTQAIVKDGTHDYTTLKMTLNTAGLALINANLGGMVVFSGRASTLDGSLTEYIFGGTYGKSTKLFLDNPVIPLPGGAAMAMVGMGLIGVRRRRSPISQDS